jgi:hypothetical protein
MGDIDSKDALISALELASAEVIAQSHSDNAGQSIDSEAERLAAQAEPPLVSNNGVVKGGGEHTDNRPLTAKQMEFCRAVIDGCSLREAYRQAYGNSTTDVRTASSNASKLMKDARIQRVIKAGQDMTIEHMVDDVVSAKRFVMGKLLSLCYNAQTESAQLRALELMGKASGAFTPIAQRDDSAVDAKVLKAEIADHLRLMRLNKPKLKAV